jgi:hypothetical protein
MLGTLQVPVMRREEICQHDFLERGIVFVEKIFLPKPSKKKDD